MIGKFTDIDIINMKNMDAQMFALAETFKEFLRWALSFCLGWVIDNGYSFFLKSKLSPDIILVIGIAFRAADYYWHKYNKEVQTDSTGKSLGLFRF